MSLILPDLLNRRPRIQPSQPQSPLRIHPSQTSSLYISNFENFLTQNVNLFILQY